MTRPRKPARARMWANVYRDPIKLFLGTRRYNTAADARKDANPEIGTAQYLGPIKIASPYVPVEVCEARRKK